MIMVSSEDLTYVYSLDSPSSMFEVIGTCVDPAITALGTGTVNDRAISSCKKLLGQVPKAHQYLSITRFTEKNLKYS